MKLFSPLLFVALCSLSPVVEASTAAFGGTVIGVGECPGKQPACLRTFTVRIGYFDYVSWSKFNGESKVGEPITRQVRTRGTVGVLDGELTNSRTIAKAFRPGTWGYFYEDTWLNLRTTPDFVWGELVRHDAERKVVVLRLHRTHKEIHLAANPPVEREFPYDGDTAFRVADEVSRGDVAAEKALTPGCWVQFHEPRPQTLLVRSSKSEFDPSELLPAAEGKRGYANDLTRPVVLEGIESATPNGVIDVAATLDVRPNDGTPGGESKRERIEARSVSFVLDGKLAPVRIANRPGWRAILCHYRSEKRPHKVFVESSASGGLRGRLVEVDLDNRRFKLAREGRSGSEGAAYTDATVLRLDGNPATPEEALVEGRGVTLLPARGRTVVCFPAAD